MTLGGKKEEKQYQYQNISIYHLGILSRQDEVNYENKSKQFQNEVTVFGVSQKSQLTV